MSDDNANSLKELLSRCEKDVAECYLEIADRLCTVNIEELENTAIGPYDVTPLLVASAYPTVRMWATKNIQKVKLDREPCEIAITRIMQQVVSKTSDDQSDDECLFGEDDDYDHIPLTEDVSSLLRSLAIIMYSCQRNQVGLQLRSSFYSSLVALCTSVLSAEDIPCALSLLSMILLIYSLTDSDDVDHSVVALCQSEFFRDIAGTDSVVQESLVTVVAARREVQLQVKADIFIDELSPLAASYITALSRSTLKNFGREKMIDFWNSTEFATYKVNFLHNAIHSDMAITVIPTTEQSLAGILQKSLCSMVTNVLRWADILSEIYQSVRDKKPTLESTPSEIELSPTTSCLISGIASIWNLFEVHTKKLFVNKLPVVSILDSEAIDLFLTYTRLGKRVPSSLSTDPLDRLREFVTAVDNLCEMMLKDPDLEGCSQNSLLAFSFGMSPQYQKSYQKATLVSHRGEVITGADNWVSALRTCLTHDVKMSIFGRVLSAVLNLNRPQDRSCHQQILEACHRCLPVWNRLGIKYSTIISTANSLLQKLSSEIASGADTAFVRSSVSGSPWTHAMIRSVASLESLSDRLLWSQFMSDCKKGQVFSKDKTAFDLLQRVLKRDENAREAIRTRQSQKQSELCLGQCSQINGLPLGTQNCSQVRSNVTQNGDGKNSVKDGENLFRQTPTPSTSNQLNKSDVQLLPTQGDTQDNPIDLDEDPALTMEQELDNKGYSKLFASKPTSSDASIFLAKSQRRCQNPPPLLSETVSEPAPHQTNSAANYLSEVQDRYKAKTPPASPEPQKRQKIDTPDAEAFLARCRDRYDTSATSAARRSPSPECSSTLFTSYDGDDLEESMDKAKQEDKQEVEAAFITRARQRENKLPGPGFQSARAIKQTVREARSPPAQVLNLEAPRLYPKMPEQLVANFYTGNAGRVAKPKLHEMLREERPKPVSGMFKSKLINPDILKTPPPKTPPQNVLSQSLDRTPAAYSLDMLDGGDSEEEEEEEDLDTPHPASFVDLAATVLSKNTPPQPPRRSPPLRRKLATENNIQQQIAKSNVSTAIHFEKQPGGAMLVSHERLVSRPVKIAEAAVQKDTKNTYYSEALLAGDRKYIEKEQRRVREKILAQRETRLRSHKMNLLKALLELQLPKGNFACTSIPTSFKDEDEYARVFWNYIVDEGTASVKQAVEEMVQRSSQSRSGSEAGVVAETILDKCEIVIEFTEGCSNYSASDLVAMSSPAWDKSVNSTSIVIGKINRYYRRCKQILVRLQQSRCSSIAFGSPIIVRPLVKVSTIFRQNWTLNHIATTALYTPLISANPADSISTSLANPPKGYRSYLDRKFNAGQTNAIIRAASIKTGFSIIQGPPGTGKTHCITGLVGLLLMEHKKILLVAPSNTACDEMSLRISRSGIRNAKGDPYFPKLMRVGVRDKVNEKLLPLYIEDILDKRLKQNAAANNTLVDLNRIHNNISSEMQTLQKKIAIAKNTDPPAAAKYQEALRQLTARAKQENWNRRKVSLQQDEERAQARNKILSEADIICTTIGSCKDIPTHFTAVVIDEAAQAVEPDVIIPLLYGAKVCVLVGDDKQLPATVLSHTAAQRGYTQSLFARLRKGGYVPHMLTTQYRMHPEIALFPNTEFYEGKLVTSDEVLVRPYDFSPFFVINIESSTAKKSASFAPSSGAAANPTTSKSLSNPAEVKSIKLLISKIKTEYANKNGGEPLPDSDFGIITPYKAQARLLTNELGNQIEVGTVDGYQGREKKIILISMVRGPGVGGIGFTGLAERLNVMLTRGQSMVGVICHVQTMSGSPLWKRLFDNARQRGLLFSDISVFCKQRIPAAPRLDLTPDLRAVAAKRLATRHTTTREKEKRSAPSPAAKKIQKTIPPPKLPSPGGLTSGFNPIQSSRVGGKGRKVMTMSQHSRAQLSKERYGRGRE
eukprot:TRINITY_DN2672_c0_g1_i1.p1 TRINITY_DN2672_c0_g1~~TRINITY_DN2672_c0_g1_i1.p1  ORF type:complete len:1922 (+),score=343.07 TRINITY_DN2672_c0_g1_i1:97-5862(+)